MFFWLKIKGVGWINECETCPPELGRGVRLGYRLAINTLLVK